MRRYFGVSPFNYLLIQSLHVLSPEGGFQSRHFVNHASKRPNIRLAIIGLVLPDLWGSVVGSACLGVEQPLFGYLWHVHIPQFNCSILVDKDIGWLLIILIPSNLYAGSSSRGEPLALSPPKWKCSKSRFPRSLWSFFNYQLFFSTNLRYSHIPLLYSSVNTIPKRIAWLVYKSLFVLNYVIISYRRQNSHFI